METHFTQMWLTATEDFIAVSPESFISCTDTSKRHSSISKPMTKYRFHAVTILFYVLHIITSTKLAFQRYIIIHNLRTLSGARIIPTSRVHTSILLLLPTVLN